MTRTDEANRTGKWARRGTVLGAMALLAFAAPACNQLTGAGNLEVKGGGETDPGGGEGGSGPAPVTQCDYPTTGFGFKVGKVVKQNSWQGYAEGAEEVTDIGIESFYDCDGTKGTNALLILTSATWCGACQQESQVVKGKLASTWKEMGIKVVVLMIEDASSKPATTDTALDWKDQFKLTGASVLADPSFSFAQSGASSTIGLPLQVLVDPRTMMIEFIEEGFSGDYSKVEGLAEKNMMAAEE